ncbi:ABC transporter B family member 11 [Abeliophyllum distichum]|uniref:ABC transporter B family member 11 n=1 Tax=Abeliophyllum distichum TaxID=126358 RepID=A0ABD1V432_9LAMI
MHGPSRLSNGVKSLSPPTSPHHRHGRARLVEDGKITFSDVFHVFFALTMAAIAISQSSSFAPDSNKAKSAAASIFAMLDRKSKIDPSDEAGLTLESVKGEIELKHVSFKYPTRPDIQIFRDLSLAIHSGKVNMTQKSGTLFSIIDSRMGSYRSKCMEKFVPLAFSCCQDKPEERPSMLEVVRELENILRLRKVGTPAAVVAAPAAGAGD